MIMGEWAERVLKGSISGLAEVPSWQMHGAKEEDHEKLLSG
jgi:hypothetical protein